MTIVIINGPNLNLLGTREPEIYGNQDFMAFMEALSGEFPEVDFEYFQSNIEGEIVDKLQECGFDGQGIVLNAGAYTHTSIAIADAIAAIDSPVIEVHVSNIFAREKERHTTLISKNCIGSIGGFKLYSYWMAVKYFVRATSDGLKQQEQE